MAVLNLKSEDLAGASAFPKVFSPSINRGKMRRHYFRIPPVVVAGDAGTTLDLVVLPRGSTRLYLSSSRIYWSAFGAARLLDIGHRAYERIDGSIEPAAAAVFDNDIDVAAAGNAAPGSDFAPGAGFLAPTYRFLAAVGVPLFATVAGGTIPVNAVVEGWFDYAEI